MYSRQHFQDGKVLQAAQLNLMDKSLAEDVAGNHWNGKTWYAYGTSITSESQGKYVPYVAQMSGMDVINKGIGGGGLVSNNKVKAAIMNTTDGKLNADLITIEVSANDGGAETGDPQDNGDTTFCGVLTQCINYLLQNTNAQIVVMMSTFGKTGSSGASTEPTPTNYKYMTRAIAMQQVCQKCGVYYIHFGDGSGMGWARMNNNMGISYNSDYIHHNTLGGYNIAHAVWSQLKNIPLWYTEVPTVEEDDSIVVEYTVTYDLSNVTCSTTQTKAYSNEEFLAIFTVESGYTLDSVQITMGGVDITASHYSNLNVTIPKPSGDIVIKVSAK